MSGQDNMSSSAASDQHKHRVPATGSMLGEWRAHVLAFDTGKTSRCSVGLTHHRQSLPLADNSSSPTPALVFQHTVSPNSSRNTDTCAPSSLTPAVHACLQTAGPQAHLSYIGASLRCISPTVASHLLCRSVAANALSAVRHQSARTRKRNTHPGLPYRVPTSKLPWPTAPPREHSYYSWEVLTNHHLLT